MKQPNVEKSAEVRGLENTVASIRTQMRLQQKQAQELAEAVKSGFMETDGIAGVVVINAAAALRACKLAGDVLA